MIQETEMIIILVRNKSVGHSLHKNGSLQDGKTISVIKFANKTNNSCVGNAFTLQSKLLDEGDPLYFYSVLKVHFQGPNVLI